MKRLIIILSLCFIGLIYAEDAHAAYLNRVKLGLVGGYSISGANLNDKDITPRRAHGYQVGATFQVPLLYGFSIQPAAILHRKGSKFEIKASHNAKAVDMSSSIDYLDIPVQLQWGPDLLLFRPFVFVEPYIGFKLSGKTKFSTAIAYMGDEIVKEIKDQGIKNFQTGIALGGGFEFGFVQVFAKYSWNFGKIYQKSDGSTSAFVKEYAEQVKNIRNSSESLRTLTVAIAFLF